MGMCLYVLKKNVFSQFILNMLFSMEITFESKVAGERDGRVAVIVLHRFQSLVHEGCQLKVLLIHCSLCWLVMSWRMSIGITGDGSSGGDCSLPRLIAQIVGVLGPDRLVSIFLSGDGILGQSSGEH
jgi:hypothetical protein